MIETSQHVQHKVRAPPARALSGYAADWGGLLRVQGKGWPELVNPMNEEFHQIQMHAEFGYQVFKDSKRPIIKLAAQLARHHHERWDGEGYPDGLKGEKISLESRLMAILDTFDALYNSRVYKPAWPLEKVQETMQEAAGKQFDPQLMQIFIENIDKFVEIQQQYPSQSN